MDLGIYCIYPAVDLFGEPREIATKAGFLSSGADGFDNSIFIYPDKQVSISCSKIGQSAIGSEIMGDQGTLLIRSISQLTNIPLSAGTARKKNWWEESKKVNS